MLCCSTCKFYFEISRIASDIFVKYAVCTHENTLALSIVPNGAKLSPRLMACDSLSAKA